MTKHLKSYSLISVKIILLGLFLMPSNGFGQSTYMVTNNKDSGKGTFRHFVNIAQKEDSIRFAEPFIIKLDSQINIRKSIWIDGLVNGKKVQLNGQGKTRMLSITGREDFFLYVRNLELSNGSANFGGALKCYALFDYCDVILENIDFNANRCLERGGAAVFSGGVVRNCMFFANHSALDGGAIYANDVEIINCIFLGNTCIERGSVGFLQNNVEVMNGSFIMNEPDLFYTIKPAHFYNSLFWNEFPLFRSPLPGKFEHCVTNGWNETGLTIIEESPFIETPDAGEDTIWGTWDDEINLKMKFGNACINQGQNYEVFYEIPTDFNGDNRIVNRTIDIGAIEYDPLKADSDSDGVMDEEDAYPNDYQQH